MNPIKLFLILLLIPFAATSQSVVTLEQREVKFNLSRDVEIDQWDMSFKSYKNLSKEEQDILYWTNYSRKSPQRFWDSVMVPILSTFPQLKGKFSTSLQDDLYKSEALPLLALNDTLISTSKGHALDIGLKRANISHTSTDGTTFSKRLQSAGIRNCGSENMSLGGGDILLSIAMLYLDYGLENLGHRKTLLNPEYISIGVGAIQYGKEELFFVQDFACGQQL
jgi:hypothetical protein